MKIIKIGLTFLSLLYLTIPNVVAQSNSLTTGGDANSSSGSVSYSMGQIDYISASDTAGNLNQGLQQPFEFFIITGTKEDGINLNIKAFPNPANYFISLDVDLADFSNLNYQLFNLQAQLVENKNILARSTLIDLRSLISGTYILKISRNQKELKSFKIIKN